MTSSLPEPIDPKHLRVSDDEREVVAERLRVAAGEGRIGLDELEDRISAVYTAKTYGELEPNSRVVHVKGFAFMGGVSVKRKPPRQPKGVKGGAAAELEG